MKEGVKPHHYWFLLCGGVVPGVTMDGLAIVDDKAVTGATVPFGGGGATQVHDLGIDAVC